MEAYRQTPKVDIGLISRHNQAGPIGRVDHEVLGSDAFPCFIDFEASSLEHHSYPIEVAWSDADGRIESWLIDPSRIPAWTDWDDRVEEELHGLSRDALRLLGRSPSWVARRLNDASTGQTLYCDGGPFDRYWLYRLFQAAGVRPAFALEDAGDLFERYLAPESLTALAQKARSLVGLRHRAVPDVHYQQVLWRLILTESEEMHRAAKKRVSDGATASRASSRGVGQRMADDADRRGDLVCGRCPGEASTPMNLRTAMKRPNIPHHWWPSRQIGPGGLSSPVGPLSILAFLERLSSVSSLLTTNRF